MRGIDKVKDLNIILLKKFFICSFNIEFINTNEEDVR